MSEALDTYSDGAGNLIEPTPDGGAVIHFQTRRPRARTESRGHTANLAEEMDAGLLANIGADIHRGIQADERSRSEWLQQMAEAVKMLGLETKRWNSGTAANDEAGAVEGMSLFDHPLLLQACIRFQADFINEMLPADGPVKIRSDVGVAPSQPGGDPSQTTLTTDDLASDLEKDMNHFLTAVASEYYPDTSRMAFRLGLFGGAFKKVYDCPLRKRPVIESIEIDDLIVDHAATDLCNAALVGRVTHRIKMSKILIERLTRLGLYRRVDLELSPHDVPTALDIAELEAQGLDQRSSESDERPHIVYECCTGLDPDDLDDDVPDHDGGYLPYKVTVEHTTRQVLAIRRNWAEDDDLRLPRKEYMKYSYVEALGFYPVGLVHILGNTVRALTATFREFIDAGMFANFPGFIYADAGGRQLTNEFRVPAGGGVPFQTGGRPITDMIMPLPYRNPDAAFMTFVQHLEESGKALGGEAAVPLNEGRANMPVGTMLAAIEQAVKPLKGVFKSLHRAQAEEFQLLRERFRENPDALWKFCEHPARKWKRAELLQALDDCRLVPMADPNTASQVQRIAMVGAVFQIAQTAPMLFKLRDTALRLMRMIGIPEPEGILDDADAINAKMAQMAQGQGGKQQDPNLNAANAALAGARAQEAGARTQKLQMETAQAAQMGGAADMAKIQQQAADRVVESQDRSADRQKDLAVAQMRIQQENVRQQGQLAKTHLEGQVKGAEAERQRQHEQGMSAVQMHHDNTMAMQQQQHDQGMAAADQMHTAAEGGAQRAHEQGLAAHQQMSAAAEGGAQREHEAGLAAQEQAQGATESEAQRKHEAGLARRKERGDG